MNQQRTNGTARIAGGYRSRYQNFVDQRKKSKSGQGEESEGHLGQSLINIVIFIALFVAILALFGFGLSRLNQVDNSNENFSPSQRSSTSADQDGLTPPYGHAEVRASASPNPGSTARNK